MNANEHRMGTNVPHLAAIEPSAPTEHDGGPHDCASAMNSGRSRGGLAAWQLRSVLAEVDAHLAENISNQQLADCARLSRWHFARAFRKSTGMSPRAYVIRRRIERAGFLMVSTDASLSEIALECGLADQSHLTRTFVKVLGETPRAWQKNRTAPSQLSP